MPERKQRIRMKTSGGSFQPEWVATFIRNRWQVWTGMGGRLRPDYAIDIEFLLKEYAGYYYLIAVNRSNISGTVTFNGFSQTVSTSEVVFESRNVSITNGSLTDNFEPFDVHVYKVFQTSGILRENTIWGPGTIPFLNKSPVQKAQFVLM